MQKFLTFLLFGVLLGAIVVLTIPNLLAHNEDILLQKIAELESRLKKLENKITISDLNKL